MQSGKIWRPAKVIKKHDARSYTVQTRDGATYRRNRKLLFKTKENFSDIQPLDANVLAHPEHSNIPNAPLSSCSTENRTIIRPDPIQPDLTRSSDAPYITRFGRVVKPNQRYSAIQWVTPK